MKLFFASLLILCAVHSFSQQKEVLQDTISVTDSNSHTGLKNPDELPETKASDSLRFIFEHVHILDEVFIESRSEFNAVSLGILRKEIKPLISYQRKLSTAGDFKLIHLLSILGGSMEVDPIINKINGRTKRLKKYVRMEEKQRISVFLEDNFSVYMLDNLEIEEELIGRFLIYLVENEEIENLVARKDFGELHFLIGDEWFKFRDFQN